MIHHHAVILSSESFRGHNYGRNHPLSIPRVPLTLDLIQSYRTLGPDEYFESRMATIEELTWFHSSDYVAAMQECQSLGRVKPSFRQPYNIGNFENPYFNNLFNIPALATGASIQGAELVLEGRMAFNPAGGMHHAASGRARGFCYLNDAVLAIIRLRKAGWRVLYLDLDAHHGDGVQHAFDHDSDVLTVSFHMDTAYAYPRRGASTTDTGQCGNAVNLPLPKATNDSEYRQAFRSLWPILLQKFAPDAVVLQTGTDILSHDPLGQFQISNRLYLEVVSHVIQSAPRHAGGVPRLLVLGGGGYHPLALARCWTGVWSLLAGWDLPEPLTDMGRRILKNIRWTDGAEPTDNDILLRSRLDTPSEGGVRDVIHDRLNQLLETHPLLAN